MAWGTPSATGTVAETNNASATPGLPSYSAGHALFLVAFARYNGTNPTLGTPSGYSLLYQVQTAAVGHLCLWVKKAGASESAPTVTVSGGSSGGTVLAFMFSASGGDVDALGSIVDQVTTNSDATADINIEVGAITPGVNNCLCLAVGSWNDNLGISTNPTGYSATGSIVSAVGADATLAVAHVIQTTAATINSSNFAMSSGSAGSLSIAISLKAAGATAPTPSGWTTPAAGTAISSASGATLAPTLPSYSVGDHLIAVLCSRNTAHTWSAPAGWTIPTNGQYNGIAIAVRESDGSETTPTFTRSASSSDAMIAYILASSGGDSTLATLIDQYATGGDGSVSNDITVPALSEPDADGSLILAIGRWGDNIGGADFAKPAWATDIAALDDHSSGGGLTLVTAYLTQATAAALSADTFNNSGSATALDYCLVVALKSIATTSPPLAIVSIDTAQVGQAMVITVENASSSGNTVTLGGESLTVSAESSTEITCSAIALGEKRYGTNVLVVTRSDGDADALEVSLLPAATAEYIDVDLTLVPAGNRPVTTATDIEAGDQLEISNPVNCALSGVEIRSDGSLRVVPTNPALDAEVDVRCHDGTVWGAAGTITFETTAGTYGTPVRTSQRNQRRARSRRVLNTGR